MELPDLSTALFLKPGVGQNMMYSLACFVCCQEFARSYSGRVEATAVAARSYKNYLPLCRWSFQIYQQRSSLKAGVGQNMMYSLAGFVCCQEFAIRTPLPMGRPDLSTLLFFKSLELVRIIITYSLAYFVCRQEFVLF